MYNMFLKTIAQIRELTFCKRQQVCEWLLLYLVRKKRLTIDFHYAKEWELPNKYSVSEYFKLAG